MEFLPLQSDSEEEMEEVSNLNDAGHESCSERPCTWGSLPDVCLRHVFEFLPDRDRGRADVVCRHWHNVMRSPSLWRFRFFHFNGRMSKFRPSERCCAVTYASSLGAYLETLEVCVYPPSKSLLARRLEEVISGLLLELTKVNSSLKSLSLVSLELDRPCWTPGLRDSIVNSLISFLHSGGSKLNSVCLTGMRNRLNHGLELLSALVHSQRRAHHQSYISSLDLKGFFSGHLQVYLDSTLPQTLRRLQGLTDLSLSYSCLSDQLLLALQDRTCRPNSSRDVKPLQTFSLHCTTNEPHQQLVFGSSWAALASSSPDLEVKLTVDQVINTNWLARILLPEIPLAEYSMTAFYAPDEDWSAKPLLSDLLSQYRHSLQYLTLDLSNYSESLDEELLELVRVCECLKDLRVWAFLNIATVARLLHIRLTQRRLLNKIRVRIYSMNDDTQEEEDQLQNILSSHPHLPPELDLLAMIYPSE